MKSRVILVQKRKREQRWWNCDLCQRRFDNDEEGLWLEIYIPKSRSFLLGTFYRPPNSSNHYDKVFVLKLDSILDGAVSLGQEVIVLGDLNTDFSAKRASIHEFKQLKALFKTLQFKQLTKEPLGDL